MLVIQDTTPLNPDRALYIALNQLASNHHKTDSRNGPCLRFKTPVTTVWQDPTQRISWSAARDANPFLHYIEAFWMLSGANDVKTVGTLAKNMYNYSDDGETLYGAYGYRWRNHFGFDQINTIIDELKANPTTRRCVLQMWDGHEELQRAISGGKDVCCNHAIAFDPCDDVLNMTVSNRSNDLVWGAMGANVVHMSILHEYVAKQAGLKLGTYYQMSNNLHLYLDLSPVMQRIASYEDGSLEANAPDCDIHRDDNQETLFSDLSISDADFVAILTWQFAHFDAGLVDPMSPSWPRAMRILGGMMNGFSVYKKDGANAAAAYLAGLEERSNWYDNAIAWLQRRPSYVRPA